MKSRISYTGDIKKIKNKYIRDFLVLWAGYPLKEATWEPEDSFPDKEALYKDLESGLIQTINKLYGIVLFKF